MIPCLHVGEYLKIPGHYEWSCHRGQGKSVWVGQIPNYGDDGPSGFSFLVRISTGKAVKELRLATPELAGEAVKTWCREILCPDAAKCRRISQEIKRS